MKRFIYLILGIVVILFVFQDKVKPYTDPVVEKAKLIWENYLASPFDYVKAAVEKFLQEKGTDENKISN